MPYIFHLNQLEGVELITKALRERAQAEGCIASADLADGIEKVVLYQDPETGKTTKLEDLKAQLATAGSAEVNGPTNVVKLRPFSVVPPKGGGDAA